MERISRARQHNAERLITHLGEAMTLAIDLEQHQMFQQICALARTVMAVFPHTANAYHRSPDDNTVRCLYCGSSDDIRETPVITGPRTAEYALTCGLCAGTWSQ